MSAHCWSSCGLPSTINASVTSRPRSAIATPPNNRRRSPELLRPPLEPSERRRAAHRITGTAPCASIRQPPVAPRPSVRQRARAADGCPSSARRGHRRQSRSGRCVTCPSGRSHPCEDPRTNSSRASRSPCTRPSRGRSTTCVEVQRSTALRKVDTGDPTGLHAAIRPLRLHVHDAAPRDEFRLIRKLLLTSGCERLGSRPRDACRGRSACAIADRQLAIAMREDGRSRTSVRSRGGHLPRGNAARALDVRSESGKTLGIARSGRPVGGRCFVL
jgi:hypothetical protein